MLHHIGIEVAPVEIGRTAELFELLGFERVEPPPALAEFTWLERDGTQVHLMPVERPTVPVHGHLAVVTPDFGAAVARLREHDFEVELRGEHWGAPRAHAIAPGGHRVELMAAAPRSSPE
ncbi:MAG TPA: VOC family protein [Solirubrobacterales bacterium]|nr:VOC family protein [Solirubrobacterales bacterium]